MPLLATPEGQRIALGYSTNVHAVVDLASLMAAIEGPVAAVRNAVIPDGELGVGLWIPAAALADLRGDSASARANRASLRQALEQSGLTVFTLNGFPYGGFHADRVKENVFRPTWLDPKRVDYTLGLGEVLADLLPEGEHGSISTSPCSFKGFEVTANDRRDMASNLITVARHFHDLHQRTGRMISLGLEPEPLGMIETTGEATRFFGDLVFPEGRTRLAYELGLPGANADLICHEHLGICFDTCHQAVEFEDPATALASLDEAGVSVVKAQLSSAIEIVAPGSTAGAAAREALRRFDEPRWFHQVAARLPDGEVLRHAELGQVLDAADSGEGRWLEADSWRVHFHVPVQLSQLAGGLRTTRPWLEDALGQLLGGPTSPPRTTHLELETYTFDVLPDSERDTVGGDVAAEMTRELGFILTRLAELGIADAVAPAARASSPPSDDAQSPKRGVLFLCVGNSCRSQMAEALARQMKPDGLTIASAGTAPASAIHPLAASVTREAGAHLSPDARPKHMADLDLDAFDCVVTLCAEADQECPVVPGKQLLRWALPDPARVERGPGAARKVAEHVRDEIRQRIHTLLS